MKIHHEDYHLEGNQLLMMMDLDDDVDHELLHENHQYLMNKGLMVKVEKEEACKSYSRFCGYCDDNKIILFLPV